jgi:hypothetical protein
MAHDYDGACAIYSARPLAGRGHASHDHHVCSLAACGQMEDIPHSVAHRIVRSLVQNALRDAGYAWGAYDLNHALMLALSQPETEAAWRAGQDVFADAQIDDVRPAEMASIFDWLKGA